jgi:hypothetical protein
MEHVPPSVPEELNWGVGTTGNAAEKGSIGASKLFLSISIELEITDAGCFPSAKK